MTFTIVIEQRAMKDISEIVNWYLSKSLVSVENFEKEITQVLEKLKTSITEHRKIIQNIRLLPLKVFPYNIYYIKRESQNKIFIVAVLHNKRDTPFIIKRLTQ